MNRVNVLLFLSTLCGVAMSTTVYGGNNVVRNFGSGRIELEDIVVAVAAPTQTQWRQQ